MCPEGKNAPDRGPQAILHRTVVLAPIKKQDNKELSFAKALAWFQTYDCDYGISPAIDAKIMGGAQRWAARGGGLAARRASEGHPCQQHNSSTVIAASQHQRRGQKFLVAVFLHARKACRCVRSQGHYALPRSVAAVLLTQKAEFCRQVTGRLVILLSALLQLCKTGCCLPLFLCACDTTPSRAKTRTSSPARGHRMHTEQNEASAWEEIPSHASLDMQSSVVAQTGNTSARHQQHHSSSTATAAQ